MFRNDRKNITIKDAAIILGVSEIDLRKDIFADKLKSEYGYISASDLSRYSYEIGKPTSRNQIILCLTCFREAVERPRIETR